MIQELGLKGFRHGDAQISEKHGGFIINCGQATANDVIYVIETIKAAVYQHYQVELELEVCLLGF
jgi:UDP-N-acetylmuramate dehydrogenase